MPVVLYLPAQHAVHRTSADIQRDLRQAQDSTIAAQFSNAHEFMGHVADDLKSRVQPPDGMRGEPVAVVADLQMSDLRELWATVFVDSGAEADVVQAQATAAAERSQLLRAFYHPGAALAWAQNKVAEIIADLPKGADDIRQGRNPGDVLDPYILAATQHLLCGGDRVRAMEATVAHKALMVLEGLLGHLHEEVLGRMRGNFRAPEPRGQSAGTLSLTGNPFPGADIVQPPMTDGDVLSFHQVKSKTGSMNSSGGETLAQQMKVLADTYAGCTLYSHSLVGTTLSGHRTMGGIKRVEPRIVCTVGNTAFKELTRSDSGAELLLRVYQSAFRLGAQAAAYDIQEASAAVVATFEREADAEGEGFLESLLHKVTDGPPERQDSRLFQTGRRRS